MKIISWNVNGIRAAERKGELEILIESEQPDVFMVQEIKGMVDQFGSFLTEHEHYAQYYSSAQKKGYAGTALWVRRDLACHFSGCHFNTVVPNAPNADEGRISHLAFDLQGQSWDLLSIYFPNGGKSEQAWHEKLAFYDCVHHYMNTLKERGRIVIVGGDMNVAHCEIDIARPKANDGKIGFHPKERAWMDRLIADGWADVWRALNPDVVDVYSWWHVISKGRERNVGWRIDYFLMEQDKLARIQNIEYLHHQMGSDHCPIMMTIE